MTEGISVAVVVRAPAGTDAALQGLRAALSLGLGGRRPAVYLLGPAAALVEATEGEVVECLEGLRAERVRVVVAASPGEEVLREVSTARFQQTF